MREHRVAPWRCRALWVVVAQACAAVACAPTPPTEPAAAREYNGPLVPSQEIDASFMWQQEITVSKGVFSHSFAAVLQSSRGELTVLGLTPFRTRAFVIRQKDRAIEFESFIEQKLPLEPRWVLVDIHRTFFDGVPRRAPKDGTITAVVAGERRRDRWQGGRLLERTYERLAEPGALIRIDYEEGYRWLEPPPRIRFDNDWYGYGLVVKTTSATMLPAPRVREGAAEERTEP